MAYRFLPGSYTDSNSKLEVVIKDDKVRLMKGYYDFEQEGFYITYINKTANLRSLFKYLYKSLDHFCWEYSGNYDDKLYQEWLKEHSIFNRL